MARCLFLEYKDKIMCMRGQTMFKMEEMLSENNEMIKMQLHFVKNSQIIIQTEKLL